MNPARCNLVLVLAFSLMASAASPTTEPLAKPRAKFEPPDGVAYHGVCLNGVWSEQLTRQNLASYRSTVTTVPLVLHSWFAHCQENAKWRTWHWMNRTPDGKQCCGPAGEYAERSRKLGLVPVIAWAWDDFQSQATAPRLQDLTAGKYDWYLDDWIAGVKEFRDPIFIRLSHEMDGDWYPYSENYQPDPRRNTTGDYIAYWTHIVDRFRAAGVTNVAWVWCVNGDGGHGKPWKDYYPGDDYVDWVAIDVYSSRNPAEEIEPFVKAFGHKPIMIPECGTGDEQTKWNQHFPGAAAWTKSLFDEINSHPQFKALCWFEYGPEWSVERNSGQLAEFQERIAAPRFAHRWTP